MTEADKDAVLKAFSNDLEKVDEQYDSKKDMTSYCLYASFEDKDGNIEHLSSFSAQNLDALIGRLEVFKYMILQKRTSLSAPIEPPKAPGTGDLFGYKK